MKEHKKENVSKKEESMGKEDKEKGKRRNVLLVKAGLL